MSYIALEGIEGCGKSSLIAELQKQFPDCLYVREPGGTPTAERIRGLLLQQADGPLTLTSELLLFTAARVELLSKVVKPALMAGRTVITDRSYHSTLAYQGQDPFTRRLVMQLVETVIAPIAAPDYVIYLDVPVDVSRARAAARGKPDTIESRSDAYFATARQYFKDLCLSNPVRYVEIDATNPLAVVVDTALRIITKQIGGRYDPRGTLREVH